MSKWHDLRKDKYDVPRTTRTVLICYQYPDSEGDAKFYATGCFGVGNKWYPTFLDGDFDGIVIGWKNIDKMDLEEKYGV